MLSDSCHAGTVFRSVQGATVPVSVADADEITRALPPLAAALTARAHADRFEQRQRDMATRGRTVRGGFTGNYEAFVAAIRRSMRADQTPETRTLGAPDPVFDAQRPFEM